MKSSTSARLKHKLMLKCAPQDNPNLNRATSWLSEAGQKLNDFISLLENKDITTHPTNNTLPDDLSLQSLSKADKDYKEEKKTVISEKKRPQMDAKTGYVAPDSFFFIHCKTFANGADKNKNS